MESMQVYAQEYQKKNFKKGFISNVTNYSFTFTVLPKKEGDKETSYVVMKSWFWESTK